MGAGTGPPEQASETRHHSGAESSPGDPEQAPPFDLAAELASAFGDRDEAGGQLCDGGFGAVFQAHDGRLNRPFSIKVSRARSSEPDRLLREARSLAQMRHSGIVAVYDIAVTSGHCFVVS